MKFIEKKITLYGIILFIFVCMAICNCKGFYLLLPLEYQEVYVYLYYLCTIVSVIFFITNYKKNFRLYSSTIKYILFTIFLFFIPQFLYTYIEYNQGVIGFFKASNQYIFIIWSIPILYLFYKDKGYHKVLNILTNILIVGYSIILINSVLKNYFDFSLFNVLKWSYKNGNVRLLNLSVLMPLVLLYNWNQIITENAKKKNWFATILILTCIFYVEQTRFLMFTVIITMFLMYLFKKRNNINKIFLYFITIILLISAIGSGLVSSYIQQFSEENNGISTSYRMKEFDFYMGKFKENKIFGIGLIPQYRIYEEYGISNLGDMNPNDIGVFGSLGVLGMGVFVLFILPMFRWLVISRKALNNPTTSKDGLLLIGLFIYLTISSATLIILNFERIALFPFCIAIFEYYNYILKKKDNEVE